MLGGSEKSPSRLREGLGVGLFVSIAPEFAPTPAPSRKREGRKVA